jgi:hypothetical protein
MSAFKFEGKIPRSTISASRLVDTDKIKNAFEIVGSERILAICQSAAEANKWVDLLAKNNTPNSAIDIKRNTSFTSSAHLQPNVSIQYNLE